jgi:FSR family fosmidomycin resistance protein-like MFS transporter
MALGVFLAGLGMFGVGLAPDLRIIVPSAMISGIGVAMFHPEGGRLANLVAGEHKGRGMSIFAVGGNVGFAIGPVLVAIFVGAFGMAGTAVFLVPSTLYALFLLRMNATFKSFGLVDAAVVASGKGKDRWGVFSIVIASLSFRSIIFSGTLSFIPLFIVAVLGQPEAFGSLMITMYSLVGVFATLFSGRVSEHFGAAELLSGCLVVILVALLIFAGLPYLPITVAVVVILAIAMNLSYPSTVTLGQSFLPNHLGTASGLSYGLVTCVGGIASPGLGFVGDTFGLIPVFLLLALAAAVSLAFALIVVRIQKAND